MSYFVAIADAGTVSAAAEHVRVAQPSLSRQLRNLERDFGADLFERGSGRLRLSGVGRALLPKARALLADAEALRRAARVYALGALERFTIAAPATTLTDVVAPFLATLELDDPVPSVLQSNGSSPSDALREGADLVIVAGRPPLPLVSCPLPALPVWAYVPATHPWARTPVRPRVAISEVAQQPIIILQPVHPSRQALDAALTTAGLNAGRVVEVSNGTLAQALCAAGRGVAVISDDPRFGLKRVIISTADHEQISVRLHCSWDPAHPAADVLAALAKRLGVFVTERYGTDAKLAAEAAVSTLAAHDSACDRPSNGDQTLLS